VRAELELECADPDIVIKAISPDLGKNGRFSAELKKGKGKLNILIESKDITGLLAGVNSYARLVKAATDVCNLED